MANQVLLFSRFVMLGRVGKYVLNRHCRGEPSGLADRFQYLGCAVKSRACSTGGAKSPSSSMEDSSSFPRSQGPPFQPGSNPPSSHTAAGDPCFAGRKESENGTSDFLEVQISVLRASLAHVGDLGWTEAAIVAGAKDAGVSPSMIASLERKEAALVEYFMDVCLGRVKEAVESGEVLKGLIPGSERASRVVRLRLEMQGDHVSRWPQALSIQAHPLNAAASFNQRAALVDAMWNAVDDVGASGIDWFVKRTALAGIYSASELYMLTDTSPGFEDTWMFVNERVRDCYDTKKTLQEAGYLAEAIGAGIVNSIQCFSRKP